MSVDEQQNVTLEFLKKIADRFGYVLNPDDEALNRVAQSMTKIRIEYGKNYCPCKRHYPLDKEVDPLCPCETFKDEIAQNGHCECHIFFDADAAEKFKQRSGLLATVTCPG